MVGGVVRLQLRRRYETRAQHKSSIFFSRFHWVHLKWFPCCCVL